MKKGKVLKGSLKLAGVPVEVSAALVVGGLGLVGVLVTALVAYQVAWIPIIATKTAVADATSIALTSTLTAQATTTAGAISTPYNGASASAPLPVESPIRVAELLPGTNCYKKVFPSEVDPLADPENALAIASLARQDGSVLTWYYTPAPDTDMIVIYSFTNTSAEGTEWTVVEKYASVTVQYQPVSGITHSFDGGCGGPGMNNPFTPLSLSSKLTNATLTTESKEFDYFSLQPGETARFEVPYICVEPGFYDISLQFRYTFQGSTQPVDSLGVTRVMCPADVMEWGLMPDEIIQGQEFTFTGSRYALK